MDQDIMNYDHHKEQRLRTDEERDAYRQRCFDDIVNMDITLMESRKEVITT